MATVGARLRGARLADFGIDSMSLNPDALPDVARTLSKRSAP